MQCRQKLREVNIAAKMLQEKNIWEIFDFTKLIFGKIQSLRKMVVIVVS